MNHQTPRWLSFVEKKLGWLAVPNLAIILVTLQAAGFLFVTLDPVWWERLALLPQAVLQEGQYWRLVTFLALPLSTSPIWVIFVLWFIYFILNAIENHWGEFKTTFYVLVSVVLTIAFSLVFGYPVTNVAHFQSTLFLAAASLFPEMEVRLFLIFPVKMKWLAWLTLAFLGFEIVQSDWLSRFYLLSIYSNYMIFFGPATLGRIKAYWRKRQFRNKFK